jgi:putative transposase
MKTLCRTYRFRLQPTKEQEILLNNHFGCVRWVYNHYLRERIEQYKVSKTSDNYYKQAATLTQLKKQPENAWLKEVNSQSLISALRHLDTAFVNFFRSSAQFPRFKSKKGKNSFTVPQCVQVKKDRICLLKFKEGIKLKLHRRMEGVVKHCTVSRTPSGKYMVSILCTVQHQPSKPTGKSCGIDLGLRDFAVTSDGERFKNYRHLKRYQRALASAQKHLGRKEKGSKHRNTQRLKVARIYEKITNTRMDLLHKVSAQTTNAYDTICVEDLHVKGLLRNRKLSRHIADASWSTFVRLLEYKAEWNNKRVVKVNRFYPSSKTCHECGYIHQDLKLSERTWTFPNGHTLDRDENAAKNILREGLNLLSSGTGDYTCRAQIRPLRKAQALKQGVHWS